MPTAMVVDDEPCLREAFECFLMLHGYTVRTAADGPEALRLLQVERPQLMLLDHNLPGMTGLEVLRHLRTFAPEIAVVLICGAPDAATREAARALGAFACLQKPVGLPELERCLALRPSPRDRRGAPRAPLPDRPAARVPGLQGVRLLDLSSTGAQIEHLDTLRTDAACTLDLPPPFRALSLPAQVVWCSVIEQKRQGEPHLLARSGLRFAPPTEAQHAALADALRCLAAAAP